MDQLCDTGLVLSLGGFSSNTPSKLPAAAPPTTASCDFKPLLTLGLSGKARSSRQDQLGRSRKIDASNDSGDLHRQGSSQSGASSFSNSSAKRGREFGGSEEYLEGEKVCFRGSDEEEEGSSARKKLRLTKEQSALLEEHFKRHSTLNPKQKQALARGLNLRTRQVEVWFQNRRARTKLKQTELDCEALKKCCETLRDENARLQKEVQELKALMQSQRTSYMKLPAATLATCPSCDRMAGGNASSGGGDNSSSSTKTAMGFKTAAKPHFFNAFANSSAAC